MALHNHTLGKTDSQLGADLPPHPLGILEIGTQIGTIGPPSLGNFPVFLMAFRADGAVCSSTMDGKFAMASVFSRKITLLVSFKFFVREARFMPFA